MSKTVLVIDDDYDFLESTHTMLAYKGYRVVTASGGTDALSKYSESKPDIVFLDIKMPKVNGYNVFTLLKNQDNNARIVFTSSYILDDTKYQSAKEDGLSGLLNKPVRLSGLIHMIKTHAK